MIKIIALTTFRGHSKLQWQWQKYDVKNDLDDGFDGVTVIQNNYLDDDNDLEDCNDLDHHNDFDDSDLNDDIDFNDL